MERERVECGLVKESEKEALIYSLDIVRVALQSRWRLKIFQRDIYLRYLEEVLLDNGIDPGAFFDFSEFRKRDDIKSAYEWGRAVQKIFFERYVVEGFEEQSFLNSIAKVDEGSLKGLEPWEVLSSEELVNLNEQCKDLSSKMYSVS